MTSPNGLTQPQTSDSSQAPSGTTQPAATTAAAEFRFGQDAEEWMRGLTPAEVTVKARQLAQLASNALTQQPAYQPPTQPQAPAQPQFDPTDYVNYAGLQQQGQQFVQQAHQQTQQMVAPAIAMAASTNLELVRQKYAKEFQRYGPDILPLIHSVPKDQWSIDNLTRMVKLALVDHLDELADDRASTRLADPALRSSGTNGLTTSQPAQGPEAQLSDAQRAQLRRQGMTPELIREHAGKFGIPVEKWYQDFAKNSVGDA